MCLIQGKTDCIFSAYFEFLDCICRVLIWSSLLGSSFSLYLALHCNVNITAADRYRLLGFPADIGRAGFSGTWDPTLQAILIRRLCLKQSMAQHGDTH